MPQGPCREPGDTNVTNGHAAPREGRGSSKCTEAAAQPTRVPRHLAAVSCSRSASSSRIQAEERQGTPLPVLPEGPCASDRAAVHCSSAPSQRPRPRAMHAAARAMRARMTWAAPAQQSSRPAPVRLHIRDPPTSQSSCCRPRSYNHQLHRRLQLGCCHFQA